MNYQNGKIYELCCIDTGERYIGSCCTTLTKRLYAHKTKSNVCASKQIIERGNYEMTLLEDFSCNRKDQLTARERFYYDLLPNINRQRPMRLETDKEAIAKEAREYRTEYNLVNKEKIAEYKKMYNDTHREETKRYMLVNRDRIDEYQKKYRLDNKATLVQSRKIYNDSRREERKKYELENKVKIAEYKKRYRLENKVKIAEYTKRYRLEKKEKLKHESMSKPS